MDSVIDIHIVLKVKEKDYMYRTENENDSRKN